MANIIKSRLGIVIKVTEGHRLPGGAGVKILDPLMLSLVKKFKQLYNLYAIFPTLQIL